MTQNMDRDSRRAQLREADLGKLRAIEQKAVRQGLKLHGTLDRLNAASHLTRAWSLAKKNGLRKQDFVESIFHRLQRSHENRQEFRLTNWTLLRGEDPKTQDLTAKYKNSNKPQKALEQYLVGVAVAAEHCGEDPDDWKLAMLRDLSIWSRQNEPIEITPPDDRPTETLAILINALCGELARRNKLEDTFEVIRQMSCRWELFSERLVAADSTCMEYTESPIYPVFDDSVEFEEMFPYPSVPLLRIPYGVGKPHVFHVAPEKLLRPLDADYLASGKYLTPGFPATGEYDGKRHYNIPDDAPGLRAVSGELYWIREIRLCIVPDGRGDLTSALESRFRVEVGFDEVGEFGGRHHVIGGYDIALARALFYARDDDGGHVFPHIHTQKGGAWRITIPHLADGSIQVTEWHERYPETTGWVFDPDPVNNPVWSLADPFMLSYTPASPPYLRHWLTQGWSLANEPTNCPWDPCHYFDNATLEPNEKWSRNLPPLHGLNFPGRSNATWIESCLHNGLIEQGLQASIENLTAQTARLQADWNTARERHSNALLRRWKSASEARKSTPKDM